MFQESFITLESLFFYLFFLFFPRKKVFCNRILLIPFSNKVSMTEILTAGALDFFNMFFKRLKIVKIKKKKSLQAYGCVSTFGKTPVCCLNLLLWGVAWVLRHTEQPSWW